MVLPQMYDSWKTPPGAEKIASLIEEADNSILKKKILVVFVQALKVFSSIILSCKNH